jgi:hypothetical protein
MDQLWIGAAIVVVVAVLAIGGWLVMSRRRRTERLTRDYGPEYRATLEATGDRGTAERELEARRERVRALNLRPLTRDEQSAYAEEWRSAQARFVDDPSEAISAADLLVQEVMRDRGYPVADFEQRAADVSVDHPHVVSEYRAAHAIAERNATVGVDTEQLRMALVHYRALFSDLLETQTDEAAVAAGGSR